MQINIDGNYSRAAEVLQRGMNLIRGTTLDEILDELSQEMQDAIIKHMMDKADSIIREEEEEREEREEEERREREQQFAGLAANQ
ncbi:hypothetical protein [Eikenella corrodens]|uniref:hypothetical protein n=1 Tax=Eikenella corrodens TaxID=539 RepID=UPI0028ED78FE|nr:hypothetical protein [Eikenella corrodens]